MMFSSSVGGKESVRSHYHVFSYRLTLVQPVQSADVVLAHLVGRAKFDVGVGDGNHGGLIVPGEGIPAIYQEFYYSLFG